MLYAVVIDYFWNGGMVLLIYAYTYTYEILDISNSVVMSIPNVHKKPVLTNPESPIAT
jgi:hypothetical protein